MKNAIQLSQMNNSPFLTIISIVRNDPEGLRLTMESVEHELPEAEHVIIDGSDNPLVTNTVRNQVKVCAGKDRGISHAFNRGILEATGTYILFLNAGDAFLDGAGNRIMSILQDKRSDCVWFPVLRVAENGVKSIYRPRLQLIKYAMSAPHQGMFVKRSIFAEIGLFPLQRYSMDHYIALKLIARTPKFSIHCESEPIADYPAGGHSTKGGVKPFIANCKNTFIIAPKHFIMAVLANGYLAIKSALS